MEARRGSLKEYVIAAIPGDGVGPEVIREGRKVVDAAARATGITIRWEEFPLGADRYLATGETLPDSVVEELRQMDAIYLGAIGDPRVPPGILETEIILKLRFAFDQYVNLRPVKLYPGVTSPLSGKGPTDIDFLVVRENTEDFYIGLGGRCAGGGAAGQTSTRGEWHHTMKRAMYTADVRVEIAMDRERGFAYQLGLITEKGAERVIRYSFELARKKGKKKVTAVDKANVLTSMYGLWREVFGRVASEYPDIETDYAFVDAATMWFVKNPESYGVVVAPNLFGDIITDLGAMIQGGMGLAAGANINPGGVSMFEPVHGSAPKYKGQGVINPMATILAGGLMLDTLGETAAARMVEDAVAAVLAEGKVRTRDLGGSSSTSEVGDAVARQVMNLARAVTRS